MLDWVLAQKASCSNRRLDFHSVWYTQHNVLVTFIAQVHYYQHIRKYTSQITFKMQLGKLRISHSLNAINLGEKKKFWDFQFRLSKQLIKEWFQFYKNSWSWLYSLSTVLELELELDTSTFQFISVQMRRFCQDTGFERVSLKNVQFDIGKILH